MSAKAREAGSGFVDGSAPVESPVVLGPIFLIDDDIIARTLLTKFLEELRVANPVVTCVDGNDAITRLDEARRRPSTAPALVVVDRHMPNRSGLEVVVWMRSQPQLRDVPVVMLSGSSDVEGIQEGYALGVAAYLVKPVAFPALGDVLRSLPLPWAIVSPKPQHS